MAIPYIPTAEDLQRDREWHRLFLDKMTPRERRNYMARQRRRLRKVLREPLP